MVLLPCAATHPGKPLCYFTYVAAGLTAPLAVGVMVTEVGPTTASAQPAMLTLLALMA